MSVPRRAERRPVEQCCQIECRKHIQNNNFVRRVRVDRLREREVRAAVVEGLVQRGLSRGIRACEAADVFVEIALALGGSDGRAGAVVVVEGEVVVVLVVEEVFLGGC